MHYFIGDLGHIFVITSFVTSLVAAFAYVRAHTEINLDEKIAWLQNARISFYIHKDQKTNDTYKDDKQNRNHHIDFSIGTHGISHFHLLLGKKGFGDQQ